MSLVDDVRKQVEGRLRELRPLVEEHEQLNALVQRLSGGGSSTAAPARRRGRPPGSKNRSTTKRSTAKRTGTKRATAKRSTAKRSTAASSGTTRRKPGRPRGRRGGNTRATQAQALVTAKPGITIPEMAKEMGIKQNYLYRVMPGLAKERKVKRVGKGWHAA